MHAYIVTGPTIESRKLYIDSVCDPQIELVHIKAEKSTISIKQIQELGTSLSIESRLKRIIWIEDANELTIPAQNALLKMLEEPPNNTTFYLTCEQISTLLQTIRSRTSHIKLQSSATQQDPQILTDLKHVMSLSPGDRLIAITKRDRTESLEWITNIELSIKQKLSTPDLNPKAYTTLAKIGKIAQIAHNQLIANCSVSLVTQNFYLLLPHTSAPK